MSVPAPTAMSWGNPGAAKRALLIHGLTASSQYWTIIADTLSKLHGAHNRSYQIRIAHLASMITGYYVVAPDLLGHGYASRPSTTDGAEYTVEKLAANVQPLLSQHGTDAPVSLVICHSLGCLVTLSLLSSGSLASHTHIVLLDPPLELSPGKLSHIHGTLAESVMHVATIEQTAGANPRWQPRDVVSQVAGKLLCDEHVVTAIINVSILSLSFRIVFRIIIIMSLILNMG